MLCGFVPTTDNILIAIRLCKCHFSIAKANMKPPINKKIILSVYCWATDFVSAIPSNGINKNGISAVTAK